MLEILRVVDNERKYKAKNGKEYSSTNYYIVYNGHYIAIRPCFKKSYHDLDFIATCVKNGK